ncbi:MAG TPA: TIR domain-containing protein [Bryobacteraceae bacterium]|jgi:hypothetical protein
MAKLKLFVGSSVNGLNYARAAQTNLNYDAWIRVWNQGIFGTGSYPVDDLLKALDDHDFGAFIFLPEDVLIINGRGPAEQKAVRDNVLFELGMFIGRLGRDRSFIIKPRDQQLHLPSDLAGVNMADFNDDPNLIAALGPAAGDILTRMKQVGPKAALYTATQTAVQTPSTPGYDRTKALEQSIARSKALVEGLKIIQSDVILASGDIKSSERMEGIQAISDQPVAELPMFLKSSAGRLVPPRVESLTAGQTVSLEFRNPNSNADSWTGAMRFSPPLAKGNPVSFKRERYTANAISFTQRERMDVTGQLQREEDTSVSFGQVYDKYLYQLVFPDGRFPKRFRLDVFLDGVRDDQESAFAERHLTELPATNTLLLDLPQPLPGYRYTVTWELPEEQADLFTKVQSGFLEEMTRRLLGLRTVNKAPTHAVRDALSETRKRLLPQEPAPEAIEMSLFVYDRQWSSLVCVASLDAEIIEKQWATYMFKPGRGVVGAAFRHRRREACCPARNAGHDGELDRYEPLTEDDRANPPHAVIALPLFYSGNKARSMAVLSFATRSAQSGLIALACDDTKLDGLAGNLDSWYESSLAEALGVITSTIFWRT